MLTQASPALRIARPALRSTQSAPFVSPHSLPLRSRSAVRQRAKLVRTLRPKSVPSLPAILAKCEAGSVSPLLPTRYRAGHENPAVAPTQVRWRAPELKAQARAALCKQAFHWRILRHVFGLVPGGPPPARAASRALRRPLAALARQPAEFYAGGLSLAEFGQIAEDPVPRLVQLLGGAQRLSARDRRLLGLVQPPDTVARPVAATPAPPAPRTVLPRYAPPSIVPARTGPYAGRRKAFKGKMRERTREAKVEGVREKMEKMEARVKTYRQEWKSVKEKSRPALPF